MNKMVKKRIISELLALSIRIFNQQCYWNIKLVRWRFKMHSTSDWNRYRWIIKKTFSQYYNSSTVELCNPWAELKSFETLWWLSRSRFTIKSYSSTRKFSISDLRRLGLVSFWLATSHSRSDLWVMSHKTSG